MKTIVNRTTAPLRIQLGHGKILHLAPGHTGQVSDDALEHKSLAALVEKGEVEVLDEDSHPRHGAQGAAPHAGGAAHHPPTGVRPKGDR
ncbi:MAG: hypothetical protein KBD01_09585 [Acidobacteria bacterium]|nr:hypothetical protein [Acidobacteriota bacterium]